MKRLRARRRFRLRGMLLRCLLLGLAALVALPPLAIAQAAWSEGGEVISGSPDEFATPIARDLAAWKTPVAGAHLELE